MCPAVDHIGNPFNIMNVVDVRFNELPTGLHALQSVLLCFRCMDKSFMNPLLHMLVYGINQLVDRVVFKSMVRFGNDRLDCSDSLEPRKCGALSSTMNTHQRFEKVPVSQFSSGGVQPAHG